MTSSKSKGEQFSLRCCGHFNAFRSKKLSLLLLLLSKQVRMIAQSSVLIGMHGAAIASSLHMPVGTKYCCGVIEIFPDGEFKPIKA